MFSQLHLFTFRFPFKLFTMHFYLQHNNRQLLPFTVNLTMVLLAMAACRQEMNHLNTQTVQCLGISLSEIDGFLLSDAENFFFQVLLENDGNPFHHGLRKGW